MDHRTLQKRKEYLETVSKNIEALTGKKYTIAYNPKDKSNHNGDAAGKGKITIKGEWGDFISDLNERYRLYYVIGHELGHKDHEPPIMIFWDFIIMFGVLIGSIATFCNGYKLVGVILFVLLIIHVVAFAYCEKKHHVPNRFDVHWNHLREIRADYCGLLFASKYIELFESEKSVKREDLANTVFPESEDNMGLIDVSHPSWETRRKCQIDHPVFNSESLEKICKEKLSCGELGTKIICRFALKGQIFILPENKIKKAEDTNG